jgi:hypothetical protein
MGNDARRYDKSIAAGRSTRSLGTMTALVAMIPL